jgi:hypothetical protein
VSPIFVRPAREQDEHDRLVRFLQTTKYGRKFDVGVNVRDEQTFPVKIGQNTYFPDLVLLADTKKPIGLVEVESGESVNYLEVMHQWVPFSRARMPFHLYVPVHAYDTARRLCEAHQAKVTEIWTYRGVTDGFDLVQMHKDPTAGVPPVRREQKSAAAAKAAPPARPATAKSAKPSRPAVKKGAVKAPRLAAKKKSARKATPAGRGRKPAARSAASAKTRGAKARGAKAGTKKKKR